MIGCYKFCAQKLTKKVWPEVRHFASSSPLVFIHANPNSLRAVEAVYSITIIFRVCWNSAARIR